MGSTENVIASEAKQSRAGWRQSGLLRSFHSLAMTVVFCFLVSAFCLLSSAAHAACSNPSGNAGEIVYNNTYNIPQYCDGTDWIGFGPNNSGAGSGGCANPAGDEGVLVFNDTHNYLQYCDGAGWVLAGAPDNSYAPNGVTFDGTNDWLGSDCGSLANSDKATGSFWFRLNDASSYEANIWRNNTSRFEIRRPPSGGAQDAITIIAEDGINTKYQAGTPAVTDTNWHHVMWSFDSATGSAHIYLDGSAAGTTATSANTGTAQFGGSSCGLGADNSGGAKWNGDMADFYLDVGTYTDLSLAGNRKKFYDDGPVNLGADGSRPTGTAPEIFLSGNTDTWHTNDGTGGGFEENGALTDAASDPPSGVSGCANPTGSAGQMIYNAGPADGLVGHWKLDEMSGTTATDSSGNGLTGTLTNMNSSNDWIAGQIAGALDFDGNNDYVGVADPGTGSILDFGSGDTITITAWVKPDALSDYSMVLTKGATASSGNPNYQLELTDGPSFTQRLSFWFTAPAGVWHGIRSDTDVLSTGQWQHIAVVFPFGSVSNAKFYHNGSEYGAVTSSGSPNTAPLQTNDPIWIGNSDDGGACSPNCVPLDGQLDDVRVYNRALSDDEVAQLATPRMQYCNGSDWIRIGK